MIEAKNQSDKSSTLRELQICEFEILKDVKRVCDDNGIQYFLVAGTLLGAV